MIAQAQLQKFTKQLKYSIKNLHTKTFHRKKNETLHRFNRKLSLTFASQ